MVCIVDINHDIFSDVLAKTRVPNGCGEPNMYMGGYRCRVTNSRSFFPLATAKPPVWCEDEPSACTQGAKQMVYWHQLEGNNVVTLGNQADGSPKSPGYNMKLGFQDGMILTNPFSKPNNANQCHRCPK